MTYDFKEFLPEIEERGPREKERITKTSHLINSKELYVDVDMNVKQNPVTNDVMLKRSVDAIIQSMKNIILGKKFFSSNPINIKSYLFEHNHVPFMQLELKDKIETAIELYEPRVILENVHIGRNDFNNTLKIIIDFKLINNESEIFQFPIFV